MRTSLFVATALSLAGCTPRDQAPKPSTDPTESVAEPMTPAATAAVEPPPAISISSTSSDAIAAFERGRGLVDHMRAPAAVASLQQAIDLDPDFALAHAYLGMVTPGTDGVAHLDRAVALAGALPEPERLWIEAQQALRRGERVQALGQLRRVVELAPGDWRSLARLGYEAAMAGRYADAVATFERVRALAPGLALAHNGLAYGHAGLGQWDAAVAAAERQVELLPGEPNPPDTLGEILLEAGRFAEAERAFLHALELEPTFAIAWQGLAFTRAYRGDPAGAEEALAEYAARAANPEERIDAVVDAAWLDAGRGKLAAATARLDVLEKDRAAQASPSFAGLALERARLLRLAGKTAAARTWLAAAEQRSRTLSGDQRHELERKVWLGKLRLAAAAGRPAADSERMVAGFEAEASASPDDVRLQITASVARGLAAWARRDLATAITELSTCDARRVLCLYDLAAVQRKVGDADGATATERRLRTTPLRDPIALYVKTRLAARR